MRIDLKQIGRNLGQYFRLGSDKEDELEVIEQVSNSISFRGANLWILIFAILIASLGLNVNSTAVIIGAMLISPLMGPIIGMGLSIGISDFDLMKRSLKNFGVATLISVVTATLYFLLSPLNEARSELLARTSPTLYDVLIAFCGGAAGVLALTTKSKGQVIPGVAIATALMPPLCTAGYGLATAHWTYFFGAFYLFFINSVFIALSTFLGVKLLRFHAIQATSPEHAKRGRRIIYTVVVITLIPAAIMTANIISRNVFDRNVSQFVNHELSQRGTQILSTHVEHDTVSVVAVGRTISDAEVSDARSRMEYYGLKDYELSVIQGTNTSNLEAIAAQLNTQASHANDESRRLALRVSEMEDRLEQYTRYDTLSAQINAEVLPLFPKVASVAVGRMDGAVTAIVTQRNGQTLDAGERRKITQWLRTRTQEEDADIVIR